MMRTLLMSCLLLFPLALDAASPRAKALLEDAERLYAAQDNAGALKAYLDAVKLDPSAESLDLIERYQLRMYFIGTPTEEETKRVASALPLARQAAQLYVHHHPDDSAGLEFLIVNSDAKHPQEAEDAVRAYVARHPNEPAAHRVRSRLYSLEGKTVEEIAEAEEVARLSTCNDEAQYIVGVIAYRAVSKKFTTPSEVRQDIIRRGMKALRRAIEMRPDNSEAILYLSIFEREEARTEKDSARAEVLTKEADQWRARGVELMQKRKAASKAAEIDRDWDVYLLQNKTIALARYHPDVFRLARKPFQIEVRQESDGEVLIRLAPDGGPEMPLPETARTAIKRALAPHAIVYEVTSIGSVPIANTKNCRLRITVVRGGDAIRMTVQFD